MARSLRWAVAALVASAAGAATWCVDARNLAGSGDGSAAKPFATIQAAIDAGDPASPFAREPEPNGGRVNLGLDGDTPAASKSVSARGGRIRRRLERMCGGLPPMPAWPTSGYLLEMEAAGEAFRVWVTSAAGVRHLQQWLAAGPDAATLGIPGAPIELDGTFNPGYRYRMKPGEVAFADAWIELCDGLPCAVQADAVRWVVNPRVWCPWLARVRAVWSCAGGTGSSCGAPVFSAP